MAAETDWAAVEAVLVAQVCAGTGLAAGKVILEGQTLPSSLSGASVPGAGRPPLPYASVWHGDEDCLSFLAETLVSDNPDGHEGDPEAVPPVVGTELLVDHDVPSEFHVRVQVFTAEVRGNSAAPVLLSKFHNWLQTDTARDAFRAAGIGLIEAGTVQNLTGLVETRIEGRAVLDLRLRYRDGAREALTYISSVEVTPTINEVPGTPFTAPKPEGQ